MGSKDSRQMAKMFFSSGNLSAEKINRCPDFRTQERNLFSVKQSATSNRGSIPLVTVEDFPHPFVQYAINFDSHEPRLFENPRVSVLDEHQAPQQTVSMKPKVLEDKKTLFRQAAPAQGTVDSQKVRVRGRHQSSLRDSGESRDWKRNATMRR
jgi:hypothetical protein